MNKAQLIDEVAKVTCSKKEAELAIGATLAAIKKAHWWDLAHLVSTREKPAQAGIPGRVRPLK
jgi:hypothetical protein